MVANPRTEELASPRILAGVPGTIEVALSLDGTLTDPTGVPTCTVTDAAGTAVATGNAIIPGAGVGKLQFNLTAAQIPAPVVLTAVWTYTLGGVAQTLTTTHEALGQLLFTLVEARAWDNAALANVTTYPNDTIARARDRILDAFEFITSRAFGTRYEREILNGTGTNAIDLRRLFPTKVRSVSERTFGTQTWVAYTAPAVADILTFRAGYLERESLGSFAVGRQNVAIEYEHGLAPVPLDITQAALILLRNGLVPSNLPDRATAQVSELGTFTLAVAGRPGQWFGFPSVDSVLSRYGRVSGVR